MYFELQKLRTKLAAPSFKMRNNQNVLFTNKEVEEKK